MHHREFLQALAHGSGWAGGWGVVPGCSEPYANLMPFLFNRKEDCLQLCIRVRGLGTMFLEVFYVPGSYSWKMKLYDGFNFVAKEVKAIAFLLHYTIFMNFLENLSYAPI